jgi:uncharacterized membrane protein YdjX (TVP38/TMEM64 family)
MTTQRRWLWIGGGVLAVAAALAFGVPLGSVLIVAPALACPLAMYFGMRGMAMGQACRHERMHGHREDGLPERRARVSQGAPDGR